MAIPLPPHPDAGPLPDSPWAQLHGAAQDAPAFSTQVGSAPHSENGQPDEPGNPALALDFQIELALQNEALRYSQRMAEGALERFSALFSNVPLALLVVDETGLILESNAMALQSLRPNETDPPLTFVLPLVLPADQARVAIGLEQAKSGASLALTKVQFHSGDTAILTADVHLARVDNPQDDLANFVCAIVDQGPVLRQIEQRETLETQLRESQKMQAIGTLAGGIAHDFNNILAAILGNTQLAKQQQRDDPAVDASLPSSVLTSLDEIEKAALRARDLVSQILTFSRKSPMARSVISLEAVVRESVRLMRVGLPPHIQLESHADMQVPPVMADATQVQQALLNLFQNAIQAMPQGTGQPGQALIRITLANDPNAPATSVLLTVSDTGVGMDEAVQARVFDPFFTTKPVGQGTGLGLSVVHGIMRAHGGAVDLISAPGKGTAFTLRFEAAGLGAPVQGAADNPQTLVAQHPLPHLQGSPGPEMARNHHAADSTPTLPSPVSATGSAHLLYVDDDSALVFLMRRALARQGIEVTACADAHQALRLLADPGFKTQLLVSDFNMPGMDGIELLRQARLIRPNLRMALASGFITPEIEDSARAAGAQDLIFKPSSLDELTLTITRLLQPGGPS